MAKFNLNLLILLLAVLLIILQARSCLTEDITAASVTQTNVVVQASGSEATTGLDLEALGALLNEVQNAEELERQLNQKGGINNLDLNSDGVVDFIAVTEFGSGAERGFSLSTEMASGVEEEIATIRVQQSTQEQAQVQIQGNEALYGPNVYYHSRIGLGDVLLFAWLFSPHPPYYSPFAWGYYPSYYGRGYTTVARSQYRAHTETVKNRATQSSKSSSFQKSNKPQFQPKTASPKARSSLSNPSRSQRSFSSQGETPSKPNPAAASPSNTTRRSSLSNPSRSQRSFSIRSSSGQRSGSSFGGGK